MKTAFILMGAISWIIVYIELIRKGIKDKACGMPFFALIFNLTWEVLYEIDCVFIAKSFMLIPLISYTVWAILDCFILALWFQYGRQYFPENCKKHFILYSMFAILIALGLQLAFYFGFDSTTRSADYSAFIINVVMSAMFLVRLFRDEDLKGQSLIVTIFKWVGTLSYTICANLNGINIFVLITGILCSILDVICIYYFIKLGKTPKCCSDKDNN